VSDHLQERAELVHVRAALPDPAAFIPGIPQPVIRSAHEHTPPPEGFFGLPRPQAGVFKPGYGGTAMRRQTRKLRDSKRPERAFADGEPRLPVSADLGRPLTRHSPFWSRTCLASSHDADPVASPASPPQGSHVS
jgi:hypothetical protein